MFGRSAGELKKLVHARSRTRPFSPLLQAKTFYRHQIMLRTRQMSKLSHLLAQQLETLKLPEDISLVVDIDPVNLA